MTKRIIVGLCATLFVLIASHQGPTSTSNGSTDGRVHTCGYVTDRGVTEHLDAYKARCGIFADTERYCWYETNDNTTRLTCGTAAQERDAEQEKNR